MLLEGSLYFLGWLLCIKYIVKYASYVLNIYFPCERNKKEKFFSSKGPTTYNFSYYL